MKLDKKVQLGIVAAIIVVMSFGQIPYSVKQLVGTGLGKAVALGGIAYMWMRHSKLVAFFLALLLLQCGKGVWEGLTCPPGQEEQGGVCVEKKTEEAPPASTPSAPPMTVPGVGTPVSAQPSSAATAPAQPMPPTVPGPQPMGTEKFDLMSAYPIA